MEQFRFESHEIRALERDGDPWWVAKDVCDALDIKNSRDAIGRLEKDEKDSVGLTDTLGRRSSGSRATK
jgi:anti-repressor protein